MTPTAVLCPHVRVHTCACVPAHNEHTQKLTLEHRLALEGVNGCL